MNLNQSVAVTTALNLTSGALGGIGALTLGNSGGSTTLTTTRSGGNLANTPTFNLTGVTYNVTYIAPSPAASITTGSELPASISGTLTINNSSGVILNSQLTVNTGLTLTSGLLATNATNLLTLGSAVSGPAGSATSYVNGPLAIDIPPTAAISRTYAIGKSNSFRPVTLSSLTLAVQSIVTDEVVNSASGGTPVAPLATLDPARYWQLSNSAAINAATKVGLTYAADDNVFDTATARVGQSSVSNGSYSTLGGTVTGTTVAGTISTGKTITLGSGGTMVVSTGASFFTGSHVFLNSGTTTVSGSFIINEGGAASGGAGPYNYHATTGTLIFNTVTPSTINSSRTYWPALNGPQNVTVQGSGGLTMSVARAANGLFQYAAAVNGADNLTLNGTAQVNTGGFVSGSPTYGSSSLLKYNTGGTYGRNGEWLPGASSGSGYPNNVQIGNNTTLDLPNSSTSSPFQMAGSLTIDSGSTIQMAGATPLTQPLNVLGSVTVNGTLTLSTASGGNLSVGGDWANNSTFTSNSRTVTFNGSSAQIIAGSSSTAFGGLTISNSAGVTMNTSGSVSGVLTLNNDLSVDTSSN